MVRGINAPHVTYFDRAALKRIVKMLNGLLPDLLRGAKLVRPRIILIRILVENVAIRYLLLKTPRDANVRLWAVPRGLGWCADYGRTEGAEDGDLLGGHLLRKCDDGLVSLDRTDESKANAAVATIQQDKRQVAPSRTENLQ